MKNTLLIAILFGISSIVFAQNQNDDISTLKKQVIALKQTNLKLDQRVNELKKTTKNLQDSLTAALKEYDVKLKATEDSLKANVVLINFVKSRYGLVDHSLKTRKTVFYIAFILFVILLIASYLLLMKRFKSVNEKNEVRVFNLKDALDVEANKTKTDMQAQIAMVKTEIASAKDDLEKKIKESKK